MRHCEPSAHTGCGNPFSLTHKKLAPQGVLTYCATRSLPYHLYANGSELLVLTPLLTSARLSKTEFFDSLTPVSLVTPGCNFILLHNFRFPEAACPGQR